MHSILFWPFISFGPSRFLSVSVFHSAAFALAKLGSKQRYIVRPLPFPWTWRVIVKSYPSNLSHFLQDLFLYARIKPTEVHSCSSWESESIKKGNKIQLPRTTNFMCDVYHYIVDSIEQNSAVLIFQSQTKNLWPQQLDVSYT